MNWFVFALASAVFAGLTSVFGKLGVSNVDSNVVTAVRTILMTLVVLLIVAMQGNFGQIWRFSSPSWGFVILSAVAGALSWLAFFKALQLGQVSQVAPIDRLSLVFALLLAVLFLGEKLTLVKFFGVALMVIGAILLAL
jgi:bacterial/archaeal transporter family protein